MFEAVWPKSAMSRTEFQDETPSWRVVVSALLCIVLPEALAMALFSSMGFAVTVAELATKENMDMAGNGLAALCAVMAAFAFVIDVHRRGPLVQVMIGILLAGFCLAASSLKCISYPWLSGLVCFALAIVMVALLRARCFKVGTMTGQHFFNGIATSFILSALIVIAAWAAWQVMEERSWRESTRTWLAEQNLAVYKSLEVNYTAECNESLINTSSTAEAAAVSSACKKAETVWFLQWASPCALAICNVIVAGFSWVFGQAAASMKREDCEDASEHEAKHVKKVLKTSFALVVLMLGIMYSAQYVSGANVTVSSGLLALGAASAAAIVGFMLLEFGRDRLQAVSQRDALAQILSGILKSDWVKAVAVACLNVCIPVMALLDMIREKIRRCTKHPPPSKGKFTTEGQCIVNDMRAWNWCSIFFKVNRLGMLGVSLLLGMKFTYVFFSWLNEILSAANLSFPVLSLMILGVGLSMFLCPIVPGSAVYLFAGVVLGAQSQNSVGFEVGVVAAAVVSSVAKMIACLLQYSMGFAMGKSVKVQQFVGVDKVPIRAMEQILKQNGMKSDKVAILVAGPDWPTSVLCGILGLRIPSMLIGTSPVILVSVVPQVLVGALLTYESGSTGLMSIVSSSVTLAAAVVQALAMFYFTYRIMRVVDQCGDELKRFRPEHAAVAELTKRELAFVESLRKVSDWNAMSLIKRSMVMLSSGCIMLCSFLLTADYSMADKFALRSFSLTNSIGASFEAGGLDGNVLNIVMQPIGWIALGLFFGGTAIDVLVTKMLARDARHDILPHQQRVQVAPCSIGNPEASFLPRGGRRSQDTE
ncbi:unnamed protein product [Effrenium voratum]|nr:unnamed protein product [Effrenium voratum]